MDAENIFFKPSYVQPPGQFLTPLSHPLSHRHGHSFPPAFNGTYGLNLWAGRDQHAGSSSPGLKEAHFILP